MIEVIDGDTFILATQQRIRVFNIDAPPLEFCGGLQAKSRLEELVLGKTVRLKGDTTDSYGRLVALVYVGNTNVNKIMLSEGCGRYEGRKSAESEELKEIARQAREKGLGIYGPLCSQKENPDNPSCLIKGNVAQDTGEKIYHFLGCSGYNRIIVEKFMGDQWFCSEDEAQKAGFIKSQNCYGKSYSD